MTATRNRNKLILAGQDVEIPAAGIYPNHTFCALDTGHTYYSDGTDWIQISAVGAPPAPLKAPAILDYDTGNTTQWRLAQVKAAYSLTFNDTHRRVPTGFSGRYEVRPGDDPLNLGTGTERAEVLGPMFDEGDEVWVGWSTWFPDNNPTGDFINFTIGSPTVGKTNEFSSIHENRGATQQFPTTAAVPPISFNIDANTVPYPYHINIHVTGGALNVNNFPVAGVQKFDIGDVPYNQWVDWVVHVIHSSNATIGRFQLWKNGVSAIGPLTTATMYPGRQNYFKQGWYRMANPFTSVVYHDMTIMDTSYNAVDPSRFD